MFFLFVSFLPCLFSSTKKILVSTVYLFESLRYIVYWFGVNCSCYFVSMLFQTRRGRCHLFALPRHVFNNNSFFYQCCPNGVKFAFSKNFQFWFLLLFLSLVSLFSTLLFCFRFSDSVFIIRSFIFIVIIFYCFLSIYFFR